MSEVGHSLKLSFLQAVANRGVARLAQEVEGSSVALVGAEFHMLPHSLVEPGAGKGVSGFAGLRPEPLCVSACGGSNPSRFRAHEAAELLQAQPASALHVLEAHAVLVEGEAVAPKLCPFAPRTMTFAGKRMDWSPHSGSQSRT